MTKHSFVEQRFKTRKTLDKKVPEFIKPEKLNTVLPNVFGSGKTGAVYIREFKLHVQTSNDKRQAKINFSIFNYSFDMRKKI
jgi:hypothetical protein